MPDMVNHPPHYQSSSGLEVIDVIKAFTEDLQGMEAVYTANILKYICHWKKKNGIEDLKKARWYLMNLIDQVETDISKEPFEKPPYTTYVTYKDGYVSSGIKEEAK